MAISRIDSPQNATIKSVAKLRTRRGREQQQRIIVDGFREVQRAADHGIEFESVFCLESHEIEPWSQVAQNSYVVSDRAFEKIAFGHRKEVVGVARTPTRTLQQLTLGDHAKIAVLEAIEKPGNAGAVMRSADGAGMDGLIIVDAKTDLFNPNAIRASLGTIFSLQIAEATFAEYVEWSGQQDIQHYLAVCSPDASDYSTVDYPKSSCAIVLGSEAEGLTDAWKDVPNTNEITIPMHGTADSLNLASSAAILFYNLVSRCRG